jgi:hypothetical protein
LCCARFVAMYGLRPSGGVQGSLSGDARLLVVDLDGTVFKHYCYESQLIVACHHNRVRDRIESRFQCFWHRRRGRSHTQRQSGQGREDQFLEHLAPVKLTNWQEGNELHAAWGFWRPLAPSSTDLSVFGT